MKPELAKVLAAAGAPPPEFWESDLEMGLEHVFAHFREEGRMEAWVEKRKVEASSLSPPYRVEIGHIAL